MEAEFEINRYNIKAGLVSSPAWGREWQRLPTGICMGHSHSVGFPGTRQKSEVLLHALIIMGYRCLQLLPDPPPFQVLPPWPLWEPEPRWTVRSFTIIVSVPSPCVPTHPRPGLLLSALGHKALFLRTCASKEGPSTHEMQEKLRSDPSLISLVPQLPEPVLP